MVNKPKIKGTAWETVVTKYLREGGFTAVERRALNGSTDKGDIAGIPGVVIEAKDQIRLDFAGFIAEVEAEKVNAACWLGVAWVKRRGKTSAADAYVVMTGRQFLEILQAMRSWLPVSGGMER